MRVVVDLVDRAVLDGAAAVHDHDPVGHLGDDAEVVRDHDDPGVVDALHLADDVHDLRLDGDVERRRRLVGDEDLRVAGDRHGDHGPLAHASRELERVLVRAPLGIGDADPRQQLYGHLRRLALALALVQHDRLGDLVADLEHGVEAGHGVLEDHRDVVAAHLAHLVLAERQQVAPLEHDGPLDDLARRVGHQTHDGQGGHRLAGAGLADDADRLVAVEAEAHPVDRLHDTGVGEEVRAQTRDLKQAFAHDYSFSLGSVASRRPLPKAMKPKTVSTSATLGKSSIHQEPAGT